MLNTSCWCSSSLLWRVSRHPPKPHVVTGGAFQSWLDLEYVLLGSKVWWLHQSTDWFGTVLARIKGVSATLALGQVACIKYNGQSGRMGSRLPASHGLFLLSADSLLYHPALEPADYGLKPLRTVHQINLFSFWVGYFVSATRKDTQLNLYSWQICNVKNKYTLLKDVQC